MPWRPLRLRSSDGLSIAGWFVPHPNPAGTILLLHGFGACKSDLLDVTQLLHRHSRFHLLLIDFRGHGESEGRTISFGRKEVLDLEAALQFLSNDPELQRMPVGCLGFSMGGAVALLAAAQFHQIGAVVTDSAYADLPRVIARTLWLSYHIPRVPFGEVVLWGVAMRLGCRLEDLNPVRVVAAVAPRPLLLIHGMEDKSILPTDAHVLSQAARDPKERWFVPGAEHVDSFYIDKQAYVNKIMEFFNHALLGTS